MPRFQYATQMQIAFFIHFENKFSLTSTKTCYSLTPFRVLFINNNLLNSGEQIRGWVSHNVCKNSNVARFLPILYPSLVSKQKTIILYKVDTGITKKCNARIRYPHQGCRNDIFGHYYV